MGFAVGRSRRLVAVFAVLGLSVAACGNSGDDGADATTAATAAATTAAAAPDTTVAGAADTTPADTTPADTTPAGPDIGEFQAISGVPGVTDKEIQYAVLGTGPSNPLGYCLLECMNGGVQAYFDYYNSLGGVHGRKLVLKTVDDELANAQTKAIEVANDPDVFAVFASPLQNTGLPEITGAGVPLYTTAPGSESIEGIDGGYNNTGPLCLKCTYPNSTGLAKLAGATKAASIGYGVSQASKDCAARTKAEIEAFGPTSGVEFVYINDELEFGMANGVGPQVTAMKDAGVDFISTCIDQNGVITLEQELHRQGMADVVVVLPQGYGDTGFLETNADLLEGDLITTFARPFEAAGDNAEAALMLEWIGKTGVLLNDYAIQGWIDANLAVAGLLAAGPQFDRDSVVAATNTLKWSANGMVPTVDWSTAHTPRGQDDPGLQCSSVLKIVGGKTQLLTDPAKPWNCFELPMSSYTDPTPTDFT